MAQSLVFCVMVGRLLVGFVWLNLYGQTHLVLVDIPLKMLKNLTHLVLVDIQPKMLINLTHLVLVDIPLRMMNS